MSAPTNHKADVAQQLANQIAEWTSGKFEEHINDIAYSATG